MPDLLRRRRPKPLVASAEIVSRSQLTDRLLFTYESWQDEAWTFYDTLGEFNYGITWLSQALSRVRLTAAEQIPGGDEPEPLTDGPAAEIMEALGGGIGGRAAIMRSFGVQLGVPGEAWLVAQRESATIPLDQATWSVVSTDEIQQSRSRGGDVEIRTGEAQWTPLPYESLVCRIWEPHKRWHWKADSSARSAIGIMREIDLYNRRIIATMVSRLAMNGILLIPQEGMIAVPEQYADAVDPFVAMLLDIASNNIRSPGNASASIPIPVRFQSDLIEKWTHLTFGDGVDEPLLEAREKAIGRLATTLNMPAEVLKGVGDTTHWNAWMIEESGIKLHISPVCETIVGGLTAGYLQPILKAAGAGLVGPHGGKIVVWYDPSELTARPDKSAQAKDLYDRLEISGTALRRESGFDEGDEPSAVEVKDQALKLLVTGKGADGMTALSKLSGDDSLAPPPPPVPGVGEPTPSGLGDDGGKPASPSGGTPTSGPPTTRDKPPPAPGPARPPATPAPATVRATPVNGRHPVTSGQR